MECVYTPRDSGEMDYVLKDGDKLIYAIIGGVVSYIDKDWEAVDGVLRQIRHE
jgi:hypothetical protein